MTDDATEEHPTGIVYAHRLRRLANPLPIPAEAVPTWDQIGLSEVIAEELEWFQMRESVAEWETMTWKLPDQRDRWTELAGLFGSTAESISVAAAAEVEATLLERALAEKQLPEPFGIARRAFGEMQCYFVIAAANRVANLSLRTLMISANYPWLWAGRPGGRKPDPLVTRFPPFSNAREHWIDARLGPVVDKIAAGSPDAALRTLGAATGRFCASPVWEALIAQRDDDFHRWRSESPFVPGIDKSSAWVEDPVARTRTIGFPRRSYSDAATLVQDVCTLAHDATLSTATLMCELREALYEALPYLTNGVAKTNRRPDGSLELVMDLT